MKESLTNSIQYLKSIGPKRAKSFNSMGINTIRDLLFYFPKRYLDRTNVINIKQIMNFVRNGYEGEITIVAKVIKSDVINYHRKSILKILIEDDTGELECVWFHGISFFSKVFSSETYFAFSGKPVLTKYGHLQIVHPDFDKLEAKESNDFFNTGKIIPHYRIPPELKKTKISDFNLRRIIHQAVEKYCVQLEESLPSHIIERKNLMTIRETIKNLHFPVSEKKLNSAIYRMKYEEFFYFELLVALKRNRIKEKTSGISFSVKNDPINKLLKSLKFNLTEAQLRVLKEIRIDMESRKPMNRLLQGDVGSGKTIVSVIAMLICICNGYQAAFMAPTEVLALQHFTNLKKLLEIFDIEIILLTGSFTNKQKKDLLLKISSNEKSIVIGTHALFEDNIEFKKLGFVVIDEQHRFGVKQRLKLIKKSHSPDVLVMSATPIPRTLSMSIYGDLDVSIIDEMPKDRLPIKTYIRGKEKLPNIFNFINKQIENGFQAYIIYPLVEESEKLDLDDAESNYELLKDTYFADKKVGILHGKMHWKDKEDIMEKFALKEYDILISTTVIEVGIDVPNTNVILINDAQRFGLSQLHQLRGRVGRGREQAHCILVTKNEFINKQLSFDFNFEYLSNMQKDRCKASIRLNAMQKYLSGFKLSEIDLRLRGPGDLFGIKQSGFPELLFADIINDSEILMMTKEDAFNLINDDPSLKKKKNYLIKITLHKNYHDNLKYAEIA